MKSTFVHTDYRKLALGAALCACLVSCSERKEKLAENGSSRSDGEWTAYSPEAPISTSKETTTSKGVMGAKSPSSPSQADAGNEEAVQQPSNITGMYLAIQCQVLDGNSTTGTSKSGCRLTEDDGTPADTAKLSSIEWGLEAPPDKSVTSKITPQTEGAEWDVIYEITVPPALRQDAAALQSTAVTARIVAEPGESPRIVKKSLTTFMFDYVDDVINQIFSPIK
jgi:hypothetical protein